MNILRIPIKKAKEAQKGTSNFVEVFQDLDTGVIYYKNNKGVLTSLTDTSGLEADIATAQAAADAAQATADAALGGYTYAEVAISSAEIKACGSTPKTILATAGANKYYDYFGSIEYTHDTANYTFTGDLLFIGEDFSYDASTKIRPNFIKSSGDRVVEFSSKSFDVLGTVGVTDYPTAHERRLNQGVVFGALNGTDPTGASAAGTILVKIYYKLKTKGTEL